MDRNLPATQSESGGPGADDAEETPLPRRQPISVAFMPLALVTFIVIAFIMAAWTFLFAAA